MPQTGSSRSGLGRPPLPGMSSQTGTAQNAGGSQPQEESQPSSSRSRRSYLDGQEYTFGESPFSSPGGSGELTFLNPNIFAVGSHGLSFSTGKSDRSRQNTLREGLDPTRGLETSTGEYGLDYEFLSHPRTTESRLAGGRKAKAKKNPFLMGNEDNPNSSQAYGVR